jgi:hypothetical protein
MARKPFTFSLISSLLLLINSEHLIEEVLFLLGIRVDRHVKRLLILSDQEYNVCLYVIVNPLFNNFSGASSPVLSKARAISPE